MKKLLLLFLVLTGMVSTASADNLTTVYLKPGSNWSQASARFALYMFGNEEDPTWTNFTKISDGLYYAYFNNKYANMILCRMNPDEKENNWTNKWNQSADLTAPSISTPVYVIGDGDWDDGSYTGVSIEASGNTIHKICVQDKDNSGYAPYFYEYQDGTWYTIDNAWPGTALTTETIAEKEWYVFKTLKTSVVGRFMQEWHDGGNFQAGGHTFDLSGGDVQYNYYPSISQSVATSEALASKGIAYFRGNNGENVLHYYFWNHEGINDDPFTTETVGGVEWLKLETYKPTIGIQFYTYDNGGKDTDKCWGQNALAIEPGNNYFYARMYNNADDSQGKAIHRYESTYYLVYGSTTDLLDGYIEMTPDDAFGHKVTLDNLAGNSLYYAIFPASAYITGTKTVTEWNSVLCPWYDGGTPNFEINLFENHNCAILPTTWKRWHINGVKAKYDITFDFSTMMWTSRPYFERDIDSYATFSSDYSVAIPDGVTAYYATAATVGSVTMTSISDGIPADEGVLLKAENNTYKFVPATSVESSVSPNLMVKGTDTGVPATDAGNNAYRYVFALQGGQTGFYNVAADITADMTGKAYLETTTKIQPDGGAHVAIIFDDETTGIKQVETAKQNVEGYYNLAGQRVAQPTKGLYIVNGKKVAIK